MTFHPGKSERPYWSHRAKRQWCLDEGQQCFTSQGRLIYRKNNLKKASYREVKKSKGCYWVDEGKSSPRAIGKGLTHTLGKSEETWKPSTLLRLGAKAVPQAVTLAWIVSSQTIRESKLMTRKTIVKSLLGKPVRNCDFRNTRSSQVWKTHILAGPTT